MIFSLLGALIIGQSSRIDVALSAVKHRPGPANYRALADAYADAGVFQKASESYELAARGYIALGDSNAGKVLEEKANRYRSEIKLYVERETEVADVMPYYTSAKWEPFYGCYLGANIDREDTVEDTFMDNDQVYRAPTGFNQASGKHHAMFFTYLAYGRRFPAHWVQVLSNSRAGVQIAWEPRSLNEVNDDSYLRRFAEMARASQAPIFLRFASEMNGDWTANSYGGNPSLYRGKFQLVARVMHEVAPNVAMVWCPNETPEEPIASYFPGDAAVDWVGVNFYSVLYNDGDRARGAEWRNPTAALDYMYKTYSAKHPMMICEWAATHRSVVDTADRDDFAITKIRQLYSALPLRYPRIKAVSWLSMNTMEHAEGDRKLNDFSLIAKPAIASAFASAVSSPYFLDEITREAAASPVRYIPYSPTVKFQPGDRLIADVRCYESTPTVVWRVDGQEVSRTTQAGSSPFALLSRATRSIDVTVVDNAGRSVVNTRISTHGTKS